MRKTRVKICGITSEEDALLAATAGADAVGLIFHPPAARGVSVIKAEGILAVLPPLVTPVGLFLDSEPYFVRQTAERLHLRTIQLHGHESPEDVKKLTEFGVLKTIHVMPGKLEGTLEPWRKAIADGLANLKGLVLETGWTSVKGGSGIENDWEQINQVKLDGGFDSLPSIILAGGLRPETVGCVIEKLRPWAVDVSSGVEESKGRKSKERVSAFIRAVRIADHGS